MAMARKGAVIAREYWSVAEGARKVQREGLGRLPRREDLVAAAALHTGILAPMTPMAVVRLPPILQYTCTSATRR